MVARPTLEEIQHLHAWLPSLNALRVQVLVLLSQRGPYPPEEIATALDIPVIGTLPFDPAGAAVLSGGGRGVPGRSLACSARRAGLLTRWPPGCRRRRLHSAANLPPGERSVPVAEGA